MNWEDIGNRNWWGRSLSARGWSVEIRFRKESSRPINRHWAMIDLYNYNYSEEAKERSREMDLDELEDTMEE